MNKLVINTIKKTKTFFRYTRNLSSVQPPKAIRNKSTLGHSASHAAVCTEQQPRLDNLRHELNQKASPDLDDFILQSINVGGRVYHGQPTSRFEVEDYYTELRKPVQEATTMDPESYRLQDFYDVEQRKVLSESWQIIGYTSGLKRQGDTIIGTAAGQPILVTRAKDGNIRGFYNVCRHRGAQLVAKNGRYPVISCPYHRWGYALDGRLLATPMFKGDTVLEAAGIDMTNESEPSATLKKAFSTEQVKNFNKKDYALLPVRVDTWGPYVYANVSGTAPPLEEYLGDVTESLREYPFDKLVSYGTSRIEVNSNWKLLAENFMEYYHLPAVHPELCDVSRVDDHIRAQGTGSYIGFVTHPLTRGDTPIDVDKLPLMPGLSNANKNTAWFHHHFPNAFYFLFPHSLYSVVLEPVGPAKTIEHANLLIHPSAFDTDDAEKNLQDAWDFFDLTNNQDVRICELVQKGVQVTQYTGGRMTFRFEETIHRFQNMIADYMVGQAKIPKGEEIPPYTFQKTGN